MFKKIGFIGVNENLIFFHRVAIEQFRNFPLKLFYLARKPKPLLKREIFTHVKGISTNQGDLQAFCNDVDHIIINNKNLSQNLLEKIIDLDKKLIPKTNAYQNLGNKIKAKQLFNYLNIPTHNFWVFDSPGAFTSGLPLLKYPIVIKKHRHYQSLPSVSYIPSQSDQKALHKSVGFIKQFRKVFVEEYKLVYGNFSTIVWRSSKQKNIIISNNICIYRDGVLLMVQPNYIKKKIKEQIQRIIDTILNKMNQVGTYIFEFYELEKLKIILNNVKIGFDVVGNVDFYNYRETQYSYYLRYIFGMNEPTENIKVNNLGGLMVIGKSYRPVKNLCSLNSKFILCDFKKTHERKWDTCHGLVLCNRTYKSHKQNRQLFKEIYKFSIPKKI